MEEITSRMMRRRKLKVPEGTARKNPLNRTEENWSQEEQR